MTEMHELGTMRVKSGLAEMLKGGVIMDVVDAEQAKIAEEAGACAVMALERVPADIRRDGGVARMSDPDMVKGIQEAVTIPVMAKCRIGHFAEAQILQSLEIDYIDESEVLTPADLEHHVDKWQFTVPFVCGCTNLGEALRRIAEGAAMIRTKGEAGTGDIVNAVTHMRSVFGGIRRLQSLRGEELYAEAKNLQAPYDLVKWVAENGRLPVVTFTAGGIATPADASLCMQLGADGVFVGSGIFKSGNPAERARAIVEATTHYLDADVLARVSAGLGEAMVGISTQTLDPSQLLETPRLVAVCHEDAARHRRRRPPRRGGSSRARPIARLARSRDLGERDSRDPDAEWVQADVRDAEAVARAMDGVDAVIHTAYRQDEDAWSTNVDGSETRRARPRRTAGSSTCRRDVVFDGDLGHYSEEDVPAPVNDYGRSKAEAELRVADAHPRRDDRAHVADLRRASTGRRSGSRAKGTRFFVDEFRSPIHVGDLAAGGARGARPRVSRPAARRRRRRRQPLRLRCAARRRRRR